MFDGEPGLFDEEAVVDLRGFQQRVGPETASERETLGISCG